MKRVSCFLRLTLLSLFIACTVHPSFAQPRAAVSYQVFYDELSPYGDWVNDPQYGYVWVPGVQRDFRPYYSDGYWLMTAYGNTWYSDYPWGWATFHYGRWTYDTYYGWVWIPGYEWAPAWVCWRHGYGYYGWAPLSPGFTITVSFSSYWCPVDWWIFIPPAHLHNHHFHHYWNGPARNDDIVHHTTIINNHHTDAGSHFKYPSGPDRADIQAQTGMTVPVYQLNDLSRPGKTTIDQNNINIYRPQISKAGDNVAPPQAVQAPRPVEKPVSVDVNADRDPEFRTSRPRNVAPIPNEPARTNEPVRNPKQDRPVEPIEKPRDIERNNPRQPVPEQPRRRYDDDIYRMPDRNQQPATNPIRNPNTEQPRNQQQRIEQPRIPERRPVERPIERPVERPAPQPPVQRPVPRVEPRRELPAQPQRSRPSGRGGED